MNGAEAIVRTLADAGVAVFFGLPGSTEAALLEAIRADGGLRYVLGLHEGVVVSMADGYARATGTPGVVGLHTSVGTMNGLSQVFNAFRDQSPVVVTAGHKDRAVLAEDGFCAFPDLPSLLRPCTKWSWQSLSAAAVPADLRRALHAASTPPLGPAFLAVPEDLLRADISAAGADSPGPARPLGPVPRPMPGAVPGPARPLGAVPGPMPGRVAVAGGPDAEALRTAADLLMSADQPVLVVGSGALGAVPELRDLADELAVPVLLAEFTDLATLPFPTGDGRFLGLYGEDPAVLDGCDLVVAVGCRVFYPFSDASRPRLPPGARLIHVHREAAEIGRIIPVDAGLAGEPAVVLAALASELRTRGGISQELRTRRAGRAAELRARRARQLSAELDAAAGLSPMAIEEVAAELGRVLPPDAILVDEGVRSSRPLLRHLSSGDGWLVLRSSGGALGWGVPAAIGAKIGRPDRPVVAVVGDGSFHFSVQSIWTAVQQRAPLVIVVLDNGGYLAVKRAIERYVRVPGDPRWHPGTELPGIDHLAVARGYGAAGVAAADREALGGAIKEGLASDQVVVVHVPVVKVTP
jgi:benzoylformate decarboxylase